MIPLLNPGKAVSRAMEVRVTVSLLRRRAQTKRAVKSPVGAVPVVPRARQPPMR
jgi:hypothetical protein